MPMLSEIRFSFCATIKMAAILDFVLPKVMHTRDFRGFYGISLRTHQGTYSEKFSFLHFFSMFNPNALGLLAIFSNYREKWVLKLYFAIYVIIKIGFVGPKYPVFSIKYHISLHFTILLYILNMFRKIIFFGVKNDPLTIKGP